MRAPISIPHVKHHYQVIFRAPEPRIQNWNLYIDAETEADARQIAKTHLAADSLKHHEVSDWQRWKIVEVNKL